MMNFLTPTPVNLLDPADFAANQRGEIPESQYTRLMSSLGLAGGCVAGLFFLVIAPFFCMMTFFAWQVSTESVIFSLVMLGFLVLIVVIVLGQIGPFWRGIRLWGALRRDRENRAIRLGQGQLDFEKGAYLVRAAGRDLILPTSSNAGGLKPGATYRFYYLEESGFVLSAEELFPASASQANTALLEILAEANQFTREDLALNRNGEFGPSQRAKAVPGLIGGLLLGAAILGFSLLLLSVGIGEEGWMTLLFPGIFLAIFAVFAGYLFLNSLLDLFAQAPLVVEGAGHKEKRTSGGKNRRTTYYYVVDGVSFKISKNAYQALLDGERYRVYALPHTKKLLTIEPL